MEFGRQIKEARKSLGMTQRDLGDAIGVSLQSIHKYECGMAYPNPSSLTALVRVLGLDPDEIPKR